MKKNFKKTTQIALLSLFTLVAAGPLSAMQHKTAGEKLDEAIDNTEEAMHNTKKKVKDSAEKAKERTEELAENAKEKAKKLHDKAKDKAHDGIDHL